MQYTATKNLNKEADNHPDFRLYRKDANGDMITEEYTKKDGTKGEGWKSFGAIWINKGDDGKFKSMSVSIDDEKTVEAETVTPPTKEEAEVNIDDEF